MKVKYNFISDARGSINGMTASRNTYGQYLRTKVTPINPQTIFQQTQRALLAQISQDWRGLTADERASFNSRAVEFSRNNIFGDSVPLTGFNLFVRLNLNLFSIGSPFITSCPLPTEIPSLTSLSLVASVGPATIIVSYAPAIDADITMVVNSTPAISAGINFVKSQFRFIRVAITADVSPLAIEAEWITRFGTFPPLGSKIFIQFKPVNETTGIPGVPFKASTVVIA